MTERTEPLVAIVYTVPLVVEGLVDALAGLGEVRAFPARGGDVNGLLESLRPAGIVVDGEIEAESAARYATAAGVPLVHVDLRERCLRLFRGRWVDAPEDATPQAVRNVLAAAIYGARSS